jgi:hypothetical protein
LQLHSEKKKRDEYLAGFQYDRLRGTAFDDRNEIIPTTETPIVTIDNLPINCAESLVWLNVTLEVANFNTRLTGVVYKIYRNSMNNPPIYQAVDCYGAAPNGQETDFCEMTHLQAIDPNPGVPGTAVSYIITARATTSPVTITGPKTATAIRIAEC